MTDMAVTDWRALLTAGERARMLDDIARVSLAVGATLFPEQAHQDLDIAAHSLATRKSPIERLGYIERALPVLTQALSQIRRLPLTDSRPQARSVSPAIRARRVSAQALLSAARRGPDTRSLEETITALALDTTDNQIVKSFLRLCQRDCEAIARIAALEGNAEAAGRAARCAVQLRGLCAEECWEEVTFDCRAWTKPPTQRARMRADYAPVFREIARFQSGFWLDWDQPLFALPPRETWRLYETWCLFTTLDALRALCYLPMAGEDTPTPDLFSAREGRLTFTPAQGRPSRVTLRSQQGQRLSLLYNDTYAQGERSLSHSMMPDIALVQDEPEQTTWILDAKFKPYALPGEEGDDINQMHGYRDAIVGSAGQRCVARAWCLYPGLANAPNRPRITYGASAGGIVGALCLRPGSEETFKNLSTLLAEWLTAGPGKEGPPPSPQTEPVPG